MTIKLIFQSGSMAGHRYAADHNITIGRDASNDIVVADPAVSLVHCQLQFEGAAVFLKDLGSTNGVRVNGMRVIRQELRDGDTLTLGKNRLSVEMTASILQSPTEAVAASRHGEELSGNIFGAVTYYLKRKIASGGMGAIYEAEQFGAEGFIKTVAIKTILPSFVRKKSFVSSFVGEAKLVANLVHPNIVQIHHLGRHEDGYYIAMDYIDGVDLAAFLSRHRATRLAVPVDLALYTVSRVCLGLDYAHNRKGPNGEPMHLVHRDVSPTNIMITREGEVKLTDFGVAKAAHFMEDDDQYLVGSVEYMSPEQAGCADVDARSDLFSLGLVAYELVTGARVFPCRNGDYEATAELVKAARIADPRTLRPELSSEVAAILMRCLARHPDDRWASAAALEEAIEHELYARGRGPTHATLARYLEEMRLCEPPGRRPAGNGRQNGEGSHAGEGVHPSQ